MSFLRKLSAKTLVVALAAAMLPVSIAVPQNMTGPAGNAISALFGASQAKADPWDGRRNYRGGGWDRGRGWDRRQRWDRGPSYYRGRSYGPPRGYYRRDRGDQAAAAIVGGIVGLGVGAAIASANQPRYVQPAPRYAAPSYAPEPWSREWYQYCSQRYRSFDPGSGTFQPYNGPRRVCR